MPIVQSAGTLQPVTSSWPPGGPLADLPPSPSSPWSSGGAPQNYAQYIQMYATQSSVRTVVDFLARNIAHLGLQIFRRVSDTDRVRLVDHELAQWFANPNPATTRYRLIESLMVDMGIFFSAYWLKVRLPNALGLVRLPAEEVQAVGWLLPDVYYWTRPDGQRIEIDPKDIVAFRGHGPFSPVQSLSPIETLRLLLLEATTSMDYRAAYWNNAARFEGVIERPLAAPKWSAEQKQSWREQWTARFSRQPGQIAVLEDGMSFKPTAWSASDSEYIPARKLTREEVAAAYHVPLPMVGILEHATFSNIREQHKNLYQDCLGPWLEFLQEEIELQLLPECDDVKDVYVEFNIAEKLKGSFEEQGTSLSTLCGRPIMTGNEGRARLNLPSMKDDPTMDQVVFSLNTATPGAAPTVDAPPDPNAPPPPAKQLPPPVPPPKKKKPMPTGAQLAPVIEAAWARQQARLEKVPADQRPKAFDSLRWDRELANDLEPHYREAGCTDAEAARAAAALASSINTETLRRLVMGEDAFIEREVEA